MANIPGFTEHADLRHPELPFHYISNHKKNPTSMVVLMPASLNAERTDRKRVHYHRWKWADAWPTSLVICMPDPVLQVSTVPNGAWFIHPEIDVIKTISSIISDIAVEAEVPNDRIVFYGSSLGGYGAIGCASHLPASRAVAEIPQIYFEKWHPLATKKVEESILHAPISRLRTTHPERLSLPERLKFANLVPPMRIITNPSDKSLTDQQDFLSWCARPGIPRIGIQSLEISTLASGHRAIPREAAVALVRP